MKCFSAYDVTSEEIYHSDKHLQNYILLPFESLANMLSPGHVVTLTLFHILGTSSGWYEEATLTSSGCSCDFDPLGALVDPATGSPFSCACCQPLGIQCGYPQHNHCKFEFDEPGNGCYGIPSRRFTLSQLGGPCLSNTTDTSCALCINGRDIFIKVSSP